MEFMSIIMAMVMLLATIVAKVAAMHMIEQTKGLVTSIEEHRTRLVAESKLMEAQSRVARENEITLRKKSLKLETRRRRLVRQLTEFRDDERRRSEKIRATRAKVSLE